jgi:uncharacterized protein HemX
MNVTEQLPQVEGLTPTILWYTLAGAVGICALIILWDKVRDVFARRKKRVQEQEAAHDSTIQGRLDRMSKQIEDLQKDINKKFTTYDKMFADDKETLSMHTRQLNEQHDYITRLFGGQKAACRGILAMLNHEITGNSVEKLQKAKDQMEDYLIDGVWPDEKEEEHDS